MPVRQLWEGHNRIGDGTFGYRSESRKLVPGFGQERWIGLPLPLPNIGGSIGTNFMTIDDYNYFFGTQTTDATGKKIGRTLTDADKQRFNNLFSNGGTITTICKFSFSLFPIKPINSFGTLGSHYRSDCRNVHSSQRTGKYRSQWKIWRTRSITLTIRNLTPGGLENILFHTREIWLRSIFQEFFVRSLHKYDPGLRLYRARSYEYRVDDRRGEMSLRGRGIFFFIPRSPPIFIFSIALTKARLIRNTVFHRFLLRGKRCRSRYRLSAKLNDVLSFGFAVTDIGSITGIKM